MVIGGVAVIAHGYARSTVDIDAGVVAGPEAIGSLLETARKYGLLPRFAWAEDFARENLVLLLEHASTHTPVDVSLAAVRVGGGGRGPNSHVRHDSNPGAKPYFLARVQGDRGAPARRTGY